MATSKVAVRAEEPPSPLPNKNNDILSFDRHLQHCFPPLSTKLEHGIESIDNLTTILRLRIEAEIEFVKSLEKIIINYDFCKNESGSLREGLEAMKADMKNEYTQRIEFANSLNEDVYQQILKLKETYVQQNKSFAHDTKVNVKQLRSNQHQYQKTKNKYDKVCNEANKARQALFNAKSNALPSNQVVKLGNKANSTSKTQQIWKKKYDDIKVIWNKEQIRFDDVMSNILKNMELNELNRMKTFADILTKWAVFITNLSANRNYDVKSLANQMSMVNPNNDLQIYMKNMLKIHPNNIYDINNNNNHFITNIYYHKNHNSKSLSMSQSFSKRQSYSLSNSETLSVKINNNMSPSQKTMSDDMNNIEWSNNNNNNQRNNRHHSYNNSYEGNKLKNIIKNKIKKIKKSDDDLNVTVNRYNGKRSTIVNVYNLNPGQRSRARHFKTQSADLKRNNYTNNNRNVDISQFKLKNNNSVPKLKIEYSESMKYEDKDPTINTPKINNNNKYRHPNMIKNNNDSPTKKINKTINIDNPTTKKDIEKTIKNIITTNTNTHTFESSFERRINRERNKESNTQSIPNDYKIEHKIYRKRSSSISESTTNTNINTNTNTNNNNIKQKFHENDQSNRINKFKYQNRTK